MTETEIHFGDTVVFIDKKGNRWKYRGTIVAPENDFARPKVKKGDKFLVFRQDDDEVLGLDKLFGG